MARTTSPLLVLVLDANSPRVKITNDVVEILATDTNIRGRNCAYVYLHNGPTSRIHHIVSYTVEGDNLKLVLGNSFIQRFRPQIDEARGFNGQPLFYLPLFDFGFVEIAEGLLKEFNMRDAMTRLNKIKTVRATG